MTWQTPYFNPIIMPEMETAIGGRRSSFIYLKGIKLTWHLQNANAFPAEIHMAIIQDRDNNNSDLDRQQNFFRDTTNGLARAHPFNPWVATDPYDFRLRFHPINSDHYRVITHEKILLAGSQQLNDTNHQNHFRMRKKYYKINRKLSFDDIDDVTPWRPFYVVYWWTPPFTVDYDPATGTQGVRFCHKTDVVYKNIM